MVSIIITLLTTNCQLHHLYLNTTPSLLLSKSGNNNGGNGGEVDVEDGGIDGGSDGSDEGNGNGGGEWKAASVGLVSPS